jgi:hypothetical protein
MNNYADNVSSEEISLLDIWKKLVQHKKVFWSIFFVVFIIGGAVIISTPPKYTFSQIVEIGKYLDEKGQNIPLADVDSAVMKIKKVFYPEALRAYGSQAAKKTHVGKEGLVIEKAGNSTLVLSIDGKLKDSDKYSFILQKILDVFVGDTKGYIDHHKKFLADTKLNLENRLNELNDFYKVMSKNDNIKNGGVLENKVMSMYINDQNAMIAQLMSDINLLQEQIHGTYNTKAASDVIVSDGPIGPAKSVLLFLVFIASLFMAFFGVFIKDFIVNFKK